MPRCKIESRKMSVMCNYTHLTCDDGTEGMYNLYRILRRCCYSVDCAAIAVSTVGSEDKVYW